MISIIVPVFNVEEYLEKCIDSILEQTYKNFEVILIDDASSDDSGLICDLFQNKDQRVQVIHLEKNLGVSNARNIGMEISKGDYIGFVDADDYLESNYLETLIEKLISSNADVAICNYIVKRKGDISVGVGKCIIYSKQELFENVMGKKSFQGFVWNKLYKSDIIKKNNLKFDVRITICEDLLFNCEYFNLIKQGVYVQKELYHYIQRKNSAYNGGYNENWKTVLEAYSKIFILYEKNKLQEYIGLTYNFLIANLDLKEKLSGIDIKENEIIEDIEKNVKATIWKVLKSDYIDATEKVKVFVKTYFFPLFVFLKRRRKN